MEARTSITTLLVSSLIGIVTVSPLRNDPSRELLLIKSSTGNPRLNVSVIILLPASSMIALAPEVNPVTLRLFSNSILKLSYVAKIIAPDAGAETKFNLRYSLLIK